MTDTFTLPADDLRAVFDIAVGSMDFGSGFLDDAEVETLRRVAGVIGVDPMEATPSMFASKYPHAFHAYTRRGGEKSPNCSRCSRVETDAIHEVHHADPE